MARSLGLTAYRALARKGDLSQEALDLPRPEGSLVWIHASEPGNLLAVHDLSKRLLLVIEDLSVLITLPQSALPAGGHVPQPTDPRISQIILAGDHPATVSAFLDHWRPTLGIWVWGGLKPNLILEASDRGCPLFLIDADVDGLDRRQNRWLPDLTRQVLSQFSAVLARSEAGYRRLVGLGLSPYNVEQTSPLLAGGQVLGCDEGDLADLSGVMGGRPAWFATNVLPREVPTVLAAHRQASRLSHRLLLILQPSQPGEGEDAARHAADMGLHVSRWDNGDYPDEITQVLLAGDPAARGLFFRVAPLSFLGSTLVPGETAIDPLDAAALGSAILYGPKVRHFMPSYSRLAAAGAARIVNDADALGAAVTSLNAPDHAAAMAHAGWDVISQGAALTDKVIDLVQETLDARASRS